MWLILVFCSVILPLLIIVAFLFYRRNSQITIHDSERSKVAVPEQNTMCEKTYGGRTRKFRLRWRIKISFDDDCNWINDRIFPRDNGFIAMPGLVGNLFESHESNLIAELISQQQTSFIQEPTKSVLENAVYIHINTELAKTEVKSRVNSVHIEYVAASFTRDMNAVK